MIAMMLPSTSPMVLLYARVVRQAETQGHAQSASASIAAFAGGYIALWTLFSILTVIAQRTLERTGALSVLMNSRSLWLSGALLIAAGLYQLTPLKTACLEQCRAPTAFHRRALAPRGSWRLADGARARPLLPRCCTRPDAAPVRRRDHESGVDCGLARSWRSLHLSGHGRASRSFTADRLRSRPYRSSLINASRTR
jgi:Predicted metal-binding integral membrane protein (DUF2182)